MGPNPDAYRRAPADIESRIRSARNRLLTLNQAAEEIGLSRTTISKYRRRFGIPAFPQDKPGSRIRTLWTSGRLERLRRLILNGCSPRAAANALGVPVAKVMLARCRYDLPKFQRANPARVVWTERRLRELKRLRHQGLSFSQVAAELNTTKRAISGAVFRYFDGLTDIRRVPGEYASADGCDA
jgi:hypothetical protein